MPASIIDGAAVAARVRQGVAERVAALKARGIRPGLAAVLVGDDAASHVYVRAKRKACADAGIADASHALPSTTTRVELERLIDTLNADPGVDGILVQLPLPSGIDEAATIARVRPDRDVDGFHPDNLGRLLEGRPRFVPATPKGVLRLLRETRVALGGAHVVIVGRSTIVGKPLAALLLQKGVDATVTVAHSRTKDLPALTRSADVLVSAVGMPGLIKRPMVRDGAVVIDVGINRVADAASPRGHRVVGDVDFDAVKEVASAITPVPGGVGPMTVAMLLENVVEAAERRAAA